MNIFTTDHPFDSQPEGKKPGLRSYLFGACLAAFIICPFIAICIWFADVNDNGDTTPGAYPPTPIWMYYVVAAAVSFFLAFVGVIGIRSFAWFFQKLSKK